MDINNYNEPLESSATSLHGLYTDFDDWVIRFNAIYRRSVRKPENKHQTAETTENNSQRNSDNTLIEDVFVADILLRQRHKALAATQAHLNYKDNEGFTFYDHVLYSLMNKNGDRRIFCRLIRSKL